MLIEISIVTLLGGRQERLGAGIKGNLYTNLRGWLVIFKLLIWLLWVHSLYENIIEVQNYEVSLFSSTIVCLFKVSVNGILTFPLKFEPLEIF